MLKMPLNFAHNLLLALKRIGGQILNFPEEIAEFDRQFF